MLAEDDADGRVRDPRHAPGADRGPHRPAARRREDRAPARRPCIGRIFWARRARAARAASSRPSTPCSTTCCSGDFILRETRSTISGERAYRFKHVLIREVAYAGPVEVRPGRPPPPLRRLARRARRRGAARDPRLPPRPGGDARRPSSTASVPPELAAEAAAALAAAGKRALSREANRAARRLLLRAVELEPTLERRYRAAVAAWRLDDLPAVAAEMEEVQRAAEQAGDDSIHGRALTALAEVALLRDADLPRARELARAGARRAARRRPSRAASTRFSMLGADGVVARRPRRGRALRADGAGARARRRPEGSRERGVATSSRTSTSPPRPGARRGVRHPRVRSSRRRAAASARAGRRSTRAASC